MFLRTCELGTSDWLGLAMSLNLAQLSLEVVLSLVSGSQLVLQSLDLSHEIRWRLIMGVRRRFIISIASYTSLDSVFGHDTRSQFLAHGHFRLAVQRCSLRSFRDTRLAHWDRFGGSCGRVCQFIMPSNCLFCPRASIDPSVVILRQETGSDHFMSIMLSLLDQKHKKRHNEEAERDERYPKIDTSYSLIDSEFSSFFYFASVVRVLRIDLFQNEIDECLRAATLILSCGIMRRALTPRDPSRCNQQQPNRQSNEESHVSGATPREDPACPPRQIYILEAKIRAFNLRGRRLHSRVERRLEGG